MATIGNLEASGLEIKVHKNGKFVPLGSIIGQSNLMHFVDSAKVKIEILHSCYIEVVLNPPIEQALALMRSGALGLGLSKIKNNPDPNAKTSDDMAQNTSSTGLSSVSMNLLSIQFHFMGLSSPEFKGLMIQPDISISPEGISITLKATGMLFEASRTYVSKNYTGSETALQIITELLGNEVIPEPEPEAQSRLSVPYNAPISQTRSNLDMVKKILSEYHCWYVYEGANTTGEKQKIRIFSVNEMRQKANSGNVKATFVCYKQIDPANRIYPLISFNAPIQNLMLPNAPFSGMKINQLNSDTKTVVSTDSSSTYAKVRSSLISSSGKGMSGGVTQPQTTEAGDSTGISRPEDAKRNFHTPARSSEHNLKDTLLGYVHDFTDTVLQFNVESIGVVNLLPGQTVRVAISDIEELTGAFDLSEVEHIMNSHGVETHMKMIRTGGLLSAASELVEKTKAKASNLVSPNAKTITPTDIS